MITRAPNKKDKLLRAADLRGGSGATGVRGVPASPLSRCAHGVCGTRGKGGVQPKMGRKLGPCYFSFEHERWMMLLRELVYLPVPRVLNRLCRHQQRLGTNKQPPNLSEHLRESANRLCTGVTPGGPSLVQGCFLRLFNLRVSASALRDVDGVTSVHELPERFPRHLSQAKADLNPVTFQGCGPIPFERTLLRQMCGVWVPDASSCAC